ncbi:hypothetical protein NW762_003649 [Fusarium torreyae]|uniref:Uncharacterized protein n=1 Tax=Fusarium torreyae TaxID=1237075 RepID=A0A9W8SBD3_9HYPO|nr:hypothetical protein NW762_003649 [Fusarium torreyae]
MSPEESPDEGGAAATKKPWNIHLDRENEPETIYCHEIEEMGLRNVLTRVLANVGSTSVRKQRLQDVHNVLVNLAVRRRYAGGRLVVTIKHLDKAWHYFDIRLLVPEFRNSDQEQANTAFPGDLSAAEDHVTDGVSSSNSQSNKVTATIVKDSAQSPSQSTKRTSDDKTVKSYPVSALTPKPPKRMPSDDVDRPKKLRTYYLNPSVSRRSPV